MYLMSFSLKSIIKGLKYIKIEKKKVSSNDKTYKYTFTPPVCYHTKKFLSSHITFITNIPNLQIYIEVINKME